MKKMLTLFAVILAIGLGAPHAEAKKFGGGKSFGKSYKTAPAQPAAKPVDTENPALGAQTAPKKSGMMGGLLGGLLAGGLFAYLLGSGAFEGLQGMDFLLIALLALGAVFLFRAMRRARSRRHSHNRPPMRAISHRNPLPRSSSSRATAPRKPPALPTATCRSTCRQALT